MPWKWQLSLKILLIGAYIVTAYLVSVEGIVGFLESLFGTNANGSQECCIEHKFSNSLSNFILTAR